MSVASITPKKSSWGKCKKALFKWWPLYLMMLPGLVYLIVYKYVPMAGTIIAFKNYRVKVGIWGSPWADPWYKHFMDFFKSPANVQIIKNTITLSIGKLLIGLIPSLIFALAISECRNKPFVRVVQTVSYLPHFLSWVIIYGICQTMLSMNTGVVNRFLVSIGLESIPFLSSNEVIQRTLIGTDLWKGNPLPLPVYDEYQKDGLLRVHPESSPHSFCPPPDLLYIFHHMLL